MKIIFSFLLLVVYANSFVGDESCKRCHIEEHSLWRGSDHDLAMQKVNTKSVLGDFTNAKFNYNGIVSTFFKKDNKFMVSTDGADGKLHNYEISYVFGVYPLQQYMIEFPDGRIQVLDIAWDSRAKKAGGQKWYHLHPNDNIKAGDVLHWSGANLNWNYMCADCHSTNLKKNYNPKTDTYKTTYSSINVSCEACHGEGDAHSKAPKEYHFNKIDIQTCAKCHSRRSQIGDNFHKGSKFSDNYLNVFLNENLYFSDGKIKDEVYVYNSFLQSKMYENGVTCKSCHNPHSLKLKGGRENVCFSCHSKPKYANKKHSHHTSVDCVSCHMPPRTYMGVDNRNDHSFRIPRPDLSVGSDIPNACNICHKDKDAIWSNKNMKKWYKKTPTGKQNFSHQLAGLRKNNYNSPQYLYDILMSNSPQIVKATATQYLGDYPSKQTYLTTIQLLRNSDEQTRLSALISLEKFPIEMRIKESIKMLSDISKIVRIEAASSLAPYARGDMPSDVQKKYNKAIEEYEESLLFTSERAESQVSLGNLYLNQHKFKEAEQAYKKALKIQKKFVPAYVNYANFLKVSKRDNEAFRVIEDGIKEINNSAVLHHILGLYYIRHQQNIKGIKELKIASKLDTGDARIQYVYAVALSETKPTEAIKVLESALEKHSGNLEILYALSFYYNKIGNISRASYYKNRADNLNRFTIK